MAILLNLPSAFELSYGGIPMQVNEPEVDAWIASRLPRQYLQEITPPPEWISRSMQALAWQSRVPDPPTLAINELFYPTGATRWAYGYFLATETAALQMISAAYSHATGTMALSLIMNSPVTGEDQDVDANPGITTKMFMLPPRPLCQVDTGLDGLYLITLVDERYYGFLNHSIQQFDNQASWTSYITGLGSALGITFTNFPTIPSGFGTVSIDSSLWAILENPAYLLDSAAWCVNSTIVRNLDGTYGLVAHSDQSYFLTRPKFNLSGGAFSDALDGQGLIPTLEAVLPANITVSFPKYWGFHGYMDQTIIAKPGRYKPRVDEPYLDTITKTIPITSATVKDVLGNNISSYHGIGTKALKTTGKAYFTNFTDTTALNDGDCATLAQLLADGYWSYLAKGVDETYLGIRGWQPESTHDIVWTYRKDRPSTRVMRKAWNYYPTEFQHELTPNSGNHDGANAANPGLELIRCNTSTPDANGRYDAFIQTKSSASAPPTGNTVLSGEAVWLTAANAESLVSSTSYLARLMTLENGRKLYETSQNGSASLGSVNTAFVRRLSAISIPAGAITQISFEDALYDTNSFFNVATPTVLTIPLTGTYQFGATIYLQQDGTQFSTDVLHIRLDTSGVAGGSGGAIWEQSFPYGSSINTLPFVVSVSGSDKINALGLISVKVSTGIGSVTLVKGYFWAVKVPGV